MLRAFCLALLVLLSGAPAAHAAGPEDALIAARLEAARSGAAQAALYTPAATVAGARRPAPLPARMTRGLSSEAADAAADYAQARGRGALLVWHRGALVLDRRFGGATPEERFDSLSMHKTLVALLVGRAIEEGRIASVNDPIGTYVAEWAGDPRGAIRIIDLLTMTGGVERQRLTSQPPYNLETRMLFGNDVWGHALARGQAQAPGLGFHYNNVETQLLGIVLERATGVPYADYLSTRLWRPIGAADAGLWADAKGKVRTYCCMLATAQDWVRVGRLFLDEGRSGGRRVIRSDWMRAATAASSLNPGYGYQLWRGVGADEARTDGVGSRLQRAEPYLTDDLVMLFGFGGQRTYVSRRCDLVIVRIGAQTQDWDDSVLPNTIIRGLPGGRC